MCLEGQTRTWMYTKATEDTSSGPISSQHHSRPSWDKQRHEYGKSC